VAVDEPLRAAAHGSRSVINEVSTVTFAEVGRSSKLI
jgi:hypothetical protein